VPTLLVTEVWGLGDVALAVPFLRAASERYQVTLLAKPHAAQVLRRLAPRVSLIEWEAPWTRFGGKYRLLRWPWADLRRLVSGLRARSFDFGVSARRDPRDHFLLWLAGVRNTVGFPRLGSGAFLRTPLPRPGSLHRSAAWGALGSELGFSIGQPNPGQGAGRRRLIVHTGAARPVRKWPRDRFEEIARRATREGWTVAIVDETLGTVEELIEALCANDCFLGNDSGPGHLAAILGLPTFTVFGPQLPEFFSPTHPESAWIEGAPCPHKPCFDSCHFSEPRCLLQVDVDSVWAGLKPWLEARAAKAGGKDKPR